ncbi:uncharacterized protein LOC105795470 isoform X2 [Gossypium raimondii]|uniref:DUF7036 domain-containing protein n=1 Tax=Gossypium raimondii TaxID=29730 RepID=A0A0D2SNL9_GOSRA|nr:uncharacterized protein LOC105795470 isoform X2 [Gossypium raimondii]KJB32775.1 hypothetical protein B456_005G260900 [Gossypium raimondii]
MGKNEDPNLQQQREQSLESGNNEGHSRFLCGMVLSRISNEFSFRCVFVLFLSLSVLLPGIFWILPFRSSNSGFEAKLAMKLSAPVHACFTLQKPVSELVDHIQKLEYDIYEEIGVPETKVAILSMHPSGESNSTNVVFGFLSNPVHHPISPVALSVLRSSLIELFLRRSNLTLTTPIFGQPSKFEILKFRGGITNLFVRLTNKNGSTMSSPVIVQASVIDSFGNMLPQRLKQLAQTITHSPARNLGLNNSDFGKVKSISLSSYLKGTLHASPPTPSPTSAPKPSVSLHPNFAPTHPPRLSPKIHRFPPCPMCNTASPSAHRPLHSPSPTPPISPASSSVVAHPPPPCPYSRPAVPPSPPSKSYSNVIPKHPPLMSPRSQLSPPNLPPIASVSYGSRPGQGMEHTKGPVSAPVAKSPAVQSPSSVAVRVSLKEFHLLGVLGVLIFHQLL